MSGSVGLGWCRGWCGGSATFWSGGRCRSRRGGGRWHRHLMVGLRTPYANRARPRLAKTGKKRSKARLNKRLIDRIDQPGIYGDGYTLFLKLRDDGDGGRGSAQWFQIINIDGKRTERGLGGYPIVSLEGRGKSRSRTAGQSSAATTRGQTRTRQRWFRQRHLQGRARRRCRHATRRLRNPKSEAQWRASLRDYAMPKLGRMRVDAIQTP